MPVGGKLTLKGRCDGDQGRKTWASPAVIWHVAARYHACLCVVIMAPAHTRVAATLHDSIMHMHGACAHTCGEPSDPAKPKQADAQGISVQSGRTYEDEFEFEKQRRRVRMPSGWMMHPRWKMCHVGAHHTLWYPPLPVVAARYNGNGCTCVV
eukprot:359412-Chlamydomonas_euryale.AAC.5